MDWGLLLTGFVFIVMVALMVAIGSLDRRIAQYQRQQIIIADQDVESGTTHRVYGIEA